MVCASRLIPFFIFCACFFYLGFGLCSCWRWGGGCRVLARSRARWPAFFVKGRACVAGRRRPSPPLFPLFFHFGLYGFPINNHPSFWQHRRTRAGGAQRRRLWILRLDFSSALFFSRAFPVGPPTPHWATPLGLEVLLSSALPSPYLFLFILGGGRNAPLCYVKRDRSINTPTKNVSNRRACRSPSPAPRPARRARLSPCRLHLLRHRGGTKTRQYSG